MSKIIKICSLLLLVCINSLFGQYEDKFKELEGKVGIAILQLDNNGVTQSEAKALTDRLRLEIFRHGIYEVMERQKMNAILDEMEFQLSDCTSNECAVEIGRLVGVQKMVAGSVSKIGEYYTVSARIIDIETGKMEMTAVEDIEGTLGMVLTQAIPSISSQLCGVTEPDYTVKQMIEKKEEKSFIKLYSAPSNSMVFLDNVYKGNTPITLEISPNTNINLKISKDNYSTHQQTVSLAPGSSKDFSIVLSKSYNEPVAEAKVENEQISETSPDKYTNNKVFRISFVAMDEVESMNNYIANIATKINYDGFQLFKNRLNYADTLKMKTFSGVSITSGQGISPYFFLDFNLGCLFSTFEDMNESDLEMQFLMPFTTINLRFNPLGTSFFNPYAMVGFGYNLLIMNVNNLDDNIGGVSYQSMGLTFGGGLEFRLANAFGIDIEWNNRDMNMELTSMGDDSERFEAAGLKSFKIKDNVYKINLNFYHN